MQTTMYSNYKAHKNQYSLLRRVTLILAIHKWYVVMYVCMYYYMAYRLAYFINVFNIHTYVT